MTHRALSWLTIAVLSLAPALATAQLPDESDLDADPDPGGDPPVIIDHEDENPDNPDTAFTARPEPTVTAEPEAPREGYPIEEVLRPITLPRFTTEVALDYPLTFSPFVTGGVLRGSFGVTDEAELGLRYGIGSFADGEFVSGKALALDFVYELRSWVGAQLSVPFYLDPFAFGVALGAPLKFTFLEKVAFEIGRDLIEIRAYRFLPVVENAAVSEAKAAAQAVGTIQERGVLNVVGRLVYQHKPNIAFDGRFGVRAIDFKISDDNPTPLELGVMYSTSEKMDFGARFGFGDLGKAKDTVGLALFAAVRI